MLMLWLGTACGHVLAYNIVAMDEINLQSSGEQESLRIGCLADQGILVAAAVHCTVKTAIYNFCGQRPPGLYDRNSMQG